jgi:hypothetical protein
MLRSIFFILFFSSFSNENMNAQIFSNENLKERSNGKASDCLKDTLRHGEVAFTKTEITAIFKGDFRQYLTLNMSIDLFMRYILHRDSVFNDTASVKFVVSKYAEVSNIQVSKSQSPFFQAEIMRLLHISACNWHAASNGGRMVNSWIQFDIYVSLVRKRGEVKMNLDFKQLYPPNELM